LKFSISSNNLPSIKKKIRHILDEGKAIGVRIVLKNTENILKAVNAISVHSQHNYIVSWLPQLLRDKHLPLFTQSDFEEAAEHGEDLYKAVDTILRDRLYFKRLGLNGKSRTVLIQPSTQIMAVLVVRTAPGVQAGDSEIEH
jgi:hypothetical protein